VQLSPLLTLSDETQSTEIQRTAFNAVAASSTDLSLFFPFEAPCSGMLIAASTSSNHLIVRLEQNPACSSHSRQEVRQAQPFVRVVKWFEEPQKKIASLLFSPDSTRLLCITIDATCFLIPVRSLLTLKQQDFASTKLGKKKDRVPFFLQFLKQRSQSLLFGDETGLDLFESPDFAKALREDNSTFVKEFKATSNPSQTSVSDCVWWKSPDNEDYVVISTLGGKLIFVNLVTSVRCSCLLETPLQRLQLIRSNLVIAVTLEGSYYSVTLDSESLSKGVFSVEPFRKFSQGTKIDVHSTGGEFFLLVSVPGSNVLEVYRSDISSEPIFTLLIRKP